MTYARSHIKKTTIRIWMISSYYHTIVKRSSKSGILTLPKRKGVVFIITLYPFITENLLKDWLGVTLLSTLRVFSW